MSDLFQSEYIINLKIALMQQLKNIFIGSFFKKYFDKYWISKSERDEQIELLSIETTRFHVVLESIYEYGQHQNGCVIKQSFLSLEPNRVKI